jgi:hypothetical protein
LPDKWFRLSVELAKELGVFDKPRKVTERSVWTDDEQRELVTKIDAINAERGRGIEDAVRVLQKREPRYLKKITTPSPVSRRQIPFPRATTKRQKNSNRLRGVCGDNTHAKSLRKIGRPISVELSGLLAAFSRCQISWVSANVPNACSVAWAGENMPAGTPIQVRLQRDELDALDRRRRKQANPPTRGSELRKLIRAVLLGCAYSYSDGDDGGVLVQPADSVASRLACGDL